MSSKLSDLDRAHVIHPYTSIADHQREGPRLLAEGKGVFLRDADGREYIDAMAGLWCVAAGYGREEIADAMADQARRLSYGHTFLAQSNEPGIRLAERLTSLTPEGLDHAFFCNSGSEANDTIIKLLWYYWNLCGRPEKKKIIARQRGYHGVTLGATSLSGLPYMHALFDAPLPGFHHVTCPNAYREAEPGESDAAFSARLADELEALILAEGPDTIAGFIGEPLMAAGGVIPPPEGYWPAIQAVLERYDICLIADEVVCGFGRLGSRFGSDHYALRPHFMTVAKAISSAYYPVSAAVISDAVFRVLAEGSVEYGMLAHGHTTSLHPVGAAAALANLDLLESEGLLDRAAQVGPGFQQALRSFSDHPLVGDVRGEGLIAGVELVADKATRRSFPTEARMGLRLHELALEEGLVVRAVGGDTLAFCPPLVIGEAELAEVVARFGRALDRLAEAVG